MSVLVMQNGITITDALAPDLESKLQSLKVRPWCRLVINDDYLTNRQDYVNAANIISKYCDLVPQVQDSFQDYTISLKNYMDRCTFIMPIVVNTNQTVEISNEPNGAGEKWNGPDVTQKMQYGNAYFGSEKRIVTLYWQPGVVEWWQANKIPGAEVWLSFYPTCTDDFQQVPAILQQLGAVGLGEFSDEQWSGLIKPTKKIMEAAKDLNVPCNFWDWQSKYELFNEVFGT